MEVLCKATKEFPGRLRSSEIKLAVFFKPGVVQMKLYDCVSSSNFRAVIKYPDGTFIATKVVANDAATIGFQRFYVIDCSQQSVHHGPQQQEELSGLNFWG